jgi:hypothetical protein
MAGAGGTLGGCEGPGGAAGGIGIGPLEEGGLVFVVGMSPALLGRLGTRVFGDTLTLRSRSLRDACDCDRRCESLAPSYGTVWLLVLGIREIAEGGGGGGEL